MISTDQLDLLMQDEGEDAQNFDRYSAHNCSHCGARLTVEEFEEFEDTCHDCIIEQVPSYGDNVYRELD